MATSNAEKSAEIRSFLMTRLEDPGLTGSAVKRYGISRQAVNQHLRKLTAEGLIRAEGQTKDRIYSLVSRQLLSKSYDIVSDLQEDRIWTSDVSPLLQALPRNVVDIWNFCFTEMFNNAIDHSEGTEISVYLESNAVETEMVLYDNGVGIFSKIQKAMGLMYEREAVLELVKGKFTTDRARHSGLGIFFSSRMLDTFDISSGSVYFTHEAGQRHDWAHEDGEWTPGTTLMMKLSNTSTRTRSGVFDQFSDGLPLNFSKTVVPVTLAQFGNEQLVSRSQAKRVLVRVEQFSHVVFDFSDVETIGQGFADEIFRVFANAHPEIKLSTVKAVRKVQEMVDAVRGEARRQARAARKATPIGKR